MWCWSKWSIKKWGKKQIVVKIKVLLPTSLFRFFLSLFLFCFFLSLFLLSLLISERERERPRRGGKREFVSRLSSPSIIFLDMFSSLSMFITSSSSFFFLFQSMNERGKERGERKSGSTQSKNLDGENWLVPESVLITSVSFLAPSLSLFISFSLSLSLSLTITHKKTKETKKKERNPKRTQGTIRWNVLFLS